jgi:hypothetical protein
MSDNGESGTDEDDGYDGEGPDEERPDEDESPESEPPDDGRDGEKENRNDAGNHAESGDEPPAGSVTLSLDATLELLANHDRRAIISYLRDASRRTATVDELAKHLVERCAAQTGERPGRSHVRSTLHHIHVPKLVDAGVVDYDARTQEVRYWGSERLEAWHDRIARDED